VVNDKRGHGTAPRGARRDACFVDLTAQVSAQKTGVTRLDIRDRARTEGTGLLTLRRRHEACTGNQNHEGDAFHGYLQKRNLSDEKYVSWEFGSFFSAGAASQWGLSSRRRKLIMLNKPLLPILLQAKGVDVSLPRIDIDYRVRHDG
jgi:hypothetical protein